VTVRHLLFLAMFPSSYVNVIVSVAVVNTCVCSLYFSLYFSCICTLVYYVPRTFVLLYLGLYLHAPITAVLYTPYTPVPSIRTHNLQTNIKETVMFCSCCLNCTRAPFTAVLHPAGTCPFPDNHKTCGKHRETLLCSSC
jgi:hypothetical protein